MQFAARFNACAQESCKIVGMEAVIELDAIDRRILRALQQDGRVTFDTLAGEAGLSSSAVLRRVRRLEEAGVIDRYVALVPPERVGLGLTLR